MSRNAEQRNASEFCRGKLIHLSFERADKAAQRSNRAKGREDEHYMPYHCTHCRGFHVGSSVVERKRRIKIRAVR